EGRFVDRGVRRQLARFIDQLVQRVARRDVGEGPGPEVVAPGGGTVRRGKPARDQGAFGADVGGQPPDLRHGRGEEGGGPVRGGIGEDPLWVDDEEPGPIIRGGGHDGTLRPGAGGLGGPGGQDRGRVTTQ